MRLAALGRVAANFAPPSDHVRSHGAAPRSPRVRFHHGSAEDLDFPTDFFDLVLSVDVIHHLTDGRAYFA